MNWPIIIGLIMLGAYLVWRIIGMRKKHQFWNVGGVKIPRKFKYQAVTATTK